MSIERERVKKSNQFVIFYSICRFKFVKQSNQQIARWIGGFNAIASFGYFTQFILDVAKGCVQNAKTSTA